ncbi:MAG: ABC transporter ATP-binding protein/permease [Phascolarctobacterium sp.]|nr:ABC transporter ATP-binding protein/permease [Phascolarctobacterium sp.]
MNISILKMVISEKMKVFSLMLCSICVCVAELAIPTFISVFIDDIITPHDSSLFKMYLCSFIGLSIFAILSNYIQNIYSAAICGRAISNVLLCVIDHIKKVPFRFFHKFDPAVLSRRIDDDVVDIVMFVLGNMAVCFSAVLNVFGVIILVYRVSIIWVIVLVLFVLLYCLYFSYIGEKLKIVYREYRNSTNEYFSKINFFVNNIKSIKIHSAQDYFIEKIRKSLQGFYRSNIRRAKISFFLSNNRSILNFMFYISLFSLGTYQVFNGIITVGQFVALIGYFNIIINSVSFFISMEDYYQNASVASIRLTEILEEPVEKNGTTSVDKISSIQLSGITKNYDNRCIIDDFSYTFLAGESYCIEGANGKGKSTLLSIIMGLEYPDNGSITFNSIPSNDLNFSDLRKKHFAVCEQIPFVPENSLESNLFFDDISDTGRMNDTHGIIPRNMFDNHRKLLVSQLSGGERQRIALFRAILKNASVVILDEPTSALDKDGINVFLSLVNNELKDKIVIVVSHDKDIINSFSHVIHL